MALNSIDGLTLIGRNKANPEANAPRGVVGPVFQRSGALALLEEDVTSDHSSDRAELYPVVGGLRGIVEP